MEIASANCSLTPSTQPATPPPKLRKLTSKPYLTIDDLVRMFAGKPRPFGLPKHQTHRPSPQSPGPRQSRAPSAPYQSRITSYFLPAANGSAPITQGLKSPNPKSFQQCMPAESLPPSCPAREIDLFTIQKARHLLHLAAVKVLIRLASAYVSTVLSISAPRSPRLLHLLRSFQLQQWPVHLPTVQSRIPFEAPAVRRDGIVASGRS